MPNHYRMLKKLFHLSLGLIAVATVSFAQSPSPSPSPISRWVNQEIVSLDNYPSQFISPVLDSPVMAVLAMESRSQYEIRNYELLCGSLGFRIRRCSNFDYAKAYTVKGQSVLRSDSYSLKLDRLQLGRDIVAVRDNRDWSKVSDRQQLIVGGNSENIGVVLLSSRMASGIIKGNIAHMTNSLSAASYDSIMTLDATLHFLDLQKTNAQLPIAVTFNFQKLDPLGVAEPIISRTAQVCARGGSRVSVPVPPATPQGSVVRFVSFSIGRGPTMANCPIKR